MVSYYSSQIFLQILFHISFLRGPRQRTCKRRCWDFYFFFFSDLLRALMRPLCIVLFKVLICHRIFLILRKFFALWDLATICFDAIKIFYFLEEEKSDVYCLLNLQNIYAIYFDLQQELLKSGYYIENIKLLESETKKWRKVVSSNR